MLDLDLSKTAFISIDLQQGILNSGILFPHTNTEVLEANNKIAAALKNTKALITLVNVDVSTFHYLHPHHSDAKPMQLPETYAELSMNIAADSTAKNVIKVTKYNPGAFFGTDLDLQLRRRGIDTLILTGVATANGVYATALDAYQHGYHLLVIEDACADRDEQLHTIFFEKLFPKISYTLKTTELLDLIQQAI
ncbi:isochorismatase family protein [Enterococcus hermanniensis]|nr:isochorismatase family protein [Enterococcus hermanniensis]